MSSSDSDENLSEIKTKRSQKEEKGKDLTEVEKGINKKKLPLKTPLKRGRPRKAVVKPSDSSKSDLSNVLVGKKTKKPKKASRSKAEAACDFGSSDEETLSKKSKRDITTSESETSEGNSDSKDPSVSFSDSDNNDPSVSFFIPRRGRGRAMPGWGRVRGGRGTSRGKGRAIRFWARPEEADQVLESILAAEDEKERMAQKKNTKSPVKKSTCGGKSTKTSMNAGNKKAGGTGVSPRGKGRVGRPKGSGRGGRGRGTAGRKGKSRTIRFWARPEDKDRVLASILEKEGRDWD